MANFLIGILNLLIKAIGTVLGFLISVLPNSPFKSISNSAVSEYLSGLAWVIPFPQIIAILQAWVSAIVVYYLYSIVLRWVKAIE